MVVQNGYDQVQIRSWLEDLGERLDRMVARAEAAEDASTGLALVREEVGQLRGLLSDPVALGAVHGTRATGLSAEDEAAAIVAQARHELAAAREEAERVREQAYDDAMQARRDFESALYARRLREQQADEVLRGFTLRPGASMAGTADGAQPRPGSRWPRLWGRLTAHAR
jgi:hypothetical protein